jgi:hypothetical protein
MEPYRIELRIHHHRPALEPLEERVAPAHLPAVQVVVLHTQQALDAPGRGVASAANHGRIQFIEIEGDLEERVGNATDVSFSAGRSGLPGRPTA